MRKEKRKREKEKRKGKEKRTREKEKRKGKEKRKREKEKRKGKEKRKRAATGKGTLGSLASPPPGAALREVEQTDARPAIYWNLFMGPEGYIPSPESRVPSPVASFEPTGWAGSRLEPSRPPARSTRLQGSDTTARYPGHGLSSAKP